MSSFASRAKCILVTGGSGFIGTNLVQRLHASGHGVMSLDCRPSPDPHQAAWHVEVDLLHPDTLQRVVKDFAPTHVVHLAARTDLVDGQSGEAYAVNTTGTRNLVAAMQSVSTIQRCIFSSSKLVCRNGCSPPECGEYCPDTAYGESKAAMERELQRLPPTPYSWCIVRPTSIWGPWFGVPYRGFFEAIARGRYFHLGRIDPPRSFGYVGNVVHQILKLLEADAPHIHQRVFYLSDYEQYSIRRWAGLIAGQLRKPAIRTLPEPLVQWAARAGDLLKTVGWRNPPLTTFRLRNMRTDTSRVPMAETETICGALPYTLEMGVEETLAWLRQQQLI